MDMWQKIRNLILPIDKILSNPYNNLMKYKYFEIGKRTRMIETENPLTTEQLQQYVQGPFEFMSLKNGTTACVNEEGLIMKLPYNPAIKQEDTDVEITFGIRGNVIIGKVAPDGEFVGIE